MKHTSLFPSCFLSVSVTAILLLVAPSALAHDGGLIDKADELLIVLPGLLIAALGLAFAIKAQSNERLMRRRLQTFQSEHDVLSASSAQLQLLVEQAGYGLWQTDHNDLTCYLNSPMRRLLAIESDCPLHRLRPTDFIQPVTAIGQDTCDPYEATLTDCHHRHYQILVINTPTGSGVLRTIIDISGRHGQHLRHRAA